MPTTEWMSVTEYAELTSLTESAIADLIENDKLVSKVENGVTYIDPSKGSHVLVPTHIPSEIVNSNGDIVVGEAFVEKTIGTIMNLHEKVLDAKEETIESIRNENLFLKEALASLQELYEEDRKTIETLTDQLKYSQKEVEFMKRKYKLMWGKVVDEYAEGAPNS